jgi:hypothetical protein
VLAGFSHFAPAKSPSTDAPHRLPPAGFSVAAPPALPMPGVELDQILGIVRIREG